MIWVTQIDGSQVMINEDRITLIEPLHDSLIRFDNGNILRVQESCEVIAQRIASWRQRALGLPMLNADEYSEEDP